MSKVIEDIGTLKINLLSQAQYDAEKAGGRLADDELYLTPSSGTGVSDVEVNGSSVVSGGVAEIELKTINQNSIVGSGDITITGGASAFIAEYGTTTYAEVKSAYDDDAVIICMIRDNDNVWVLQLAYYDDINNMFMFAEPYVRGCYWARVESDDTWNDGSFSFASTNTATTSTNGLMSSTDKDKLDGIASGAEVNVQSNWSQSDSTADDYIKNKPTIPTITDTYSGTSSNGMSGKAVKSAIDALDGTVSGSAGAGKTLTAFSQTDGKVSATFSNISITKSQVSDFPTIPTVNNATLTIQKNGTNVNTFTANASSNVTANITVPTDTGDLTNGAGFITSGDVPKEVYWATYGTTTSAEIETAYQAGKLVCVEHADIVYVLSERYTSTRHYFGAVSTPYLYRAYCNNDAWSVADIRYTNNPSANMIAEFDSTAHMNSTDMTSAEVSSFVGNLGYTFNLIDMFYPVGSYYETSDGTFDPNVAWGGTWSLESAGQVHVSAGTGYTLGDTGGEASHTVTSTEVPNHDHSLYGTGVAMISNYANRTFFQNINSPAGYMVKEWSTLTGSAGYNWNHNGDGATTSSTEYYSLGSATNLLGKTGKIGNPTSGADDLSLMQPYIVVNRWHRTA